MKFLLAALLLTPIARAAENPCQIVPGVGCWYKPENWNGTLLVYLRGHHPKYKSHVPAKRLLESSRQAFDFYGLKAAADASGAKVLVTGNSSIPVGLETVARLRPQRVVVAAHSGGYAALPATLDNLKPVERVALLDMFYGEKSLPKLAAAVARSGAKCSGYFTAHNRERYERLFQPAAPGCEVQNGSAWGHNAGVNRCLASFLAGRSCQ